MNIIKKIGSIFIVCLIFSNAFSQQATKKNTKQALPEGVEEYIPVMSESSSSSYSFHYNPLPANISGNNQYRIYDANNNKYLLFCEADNYNRDYLGVIDKDWNVILPNVFTIYTAQQSNSLIVHIEGTSGVYNCTERKWDIPLVYRDLNRLSSNIFAANNGYLMGVVNNSNDTIVPFEYEKIEVIESFDTAFVLVIKDTKYGVLDVTKNKLLIPCVYDYLVYLADKKLFKAIKFNKVGFIDINNTIKKEFTILPNYFGAAMPKKAKTINAIDQTGKISPVKYKATTNTSVFLAQNSAGKYGFILKNGKVILPIQFEGIRDISDSIWFLTSRNEKYGLVKINNQKAEEILPCEYDNIFKCLKNYLISKSNNYAILNTEAKPITEGTYDFINPFPFRYTAQNTYIARKDTVSSVLLENGQTLTKYPYKEILPIYEDNSEREYYEYMSAYMPNGKCCIITRFGQVITEPLFDAVISGGKDNDLFVVTCNNEYKIYSIKNQSFMNTSYDIIVQKGNQYISILGSQIYILKYKDGNIVSTPTIAQ